MLTSTGGSGRSIVVVWVLLCAPTGARAKDCAYLAGRIAQSAARRGVRRVAVLPFLDAAGAPSRNGVVVAERLLGELSEHPGLEIVERSLLDEVLREQRLGAAGMLDPATVRRLGRVLGVEAVVGGTTIETIAGQVEVHARLVDVETARVLAAAAARIDKDWSDFEPSSVWTALAPPVPAFAGDRAPDWHDSVRSADPAGADGGCDRDDEAWIEASARYWALRLRDPAFDARTLRRNPGSNIADPRSRERFFSRLRRWYDEPSAPPLSETERAALARCAP